MLLPCACSTADSFNVVCRLDHGGKLDDAPKNKKHNVATSLLRGKLHRQDFAGPISLRASKALGPISRYRVADILPHMKLASRASRLGSRLVFYASCATVCARHEDFTLKETSKRVVLDVGMNPILSHYNECPNLYNMFTSIWEQANELPRRNHLLHDLITQIFLRNLQYGIVVMGFIDAFVYAHWGLHERENPLYDGYHSLSLPLLPTHIK